MESRANYTLRLLLEEMGDVIPSFKVGQIFETLKSIYPNTNDMRRENRNIIVEGVMMTKPLAVSRKSKELFRKEESPLYNFFKDSTRGDFLKVVKVDGDNAYCQNVSLKEDIANKYYKNELIKISKEDILNGNLKQFKRNVNKFFINKEA